MNGTPRAQGCAGAASLKLARCLARTVESVHGFAISEEGAGVGGYYQDSLMYIHVSLDTRLPASYGPASNLPPRL